jgi:hypothetical protein
LIGNGYCGPNSGSGSLFDRCQWQSGSTQTATLGNCQAACNAVAACVAIGFRANGNCGLQMSGPVSYATCPPGSYVITSGSATATSCSVVYHTSHYGYQCYRRDC